MRQNMKNGCNRIIVKGKYCVLLIFYFVHVTSMQAQSFFTVIDDDAASLEAINSVVEVADSCGISICFGVIAEKIRRDSSLVNRLLQLQKQGHQIINHSYSHAATIWKHPEPNAVMNEIYQSKRKLDSLGFINHDFFVYPFGRFDKRTLTWIIDSVKPHFRMAFNSRGCVNRWDEFNRFYISRLPIRKHDNLIVLKYEIDQARQANGWVVLLNHSGMKRDYDPKYLKEVIGYCMANNMKCLTVNEAYFLLKNRNLLKEDKPLSWNRFDELLYLIHHHILYIGGCVILLTIIIGIIIKRLLLK